MTTGVLQHFPPTLIAATMTDTALEVVLTGAPCEHAVAHLHPGLMPHTVYSSNRAEARST